jgi:hypothetical protein
MDRASALVIARSERKRLRVIARTCGPLGGRDGWLSLSRTRRHPLVFYPDPGGRDLRDRAAWLRNRCKRQSLRRCCDRQDESANRNQPGHLLCPTVAD